MVVMMMMMIIRGRRSRRKTLVVVSSRVLTGSSVSGVHCISLHTMECLTLIGDYCAAAAAAAAGPEKGVSREDIMIIFSLYFHTSLKCEMQTTLIKNKSDVCVGRRA